MNFHTTSKAAGCALFAIGLLGSASQADAALTVPTDLAPGSEYRIVFVTSSAMNGYGRLTDSSFAHDAYVNTAANAAGSLLASLASHWIVIGSEDRAIQAGLYANERVAGAMPIYLLDGTRVANNATDLWDGSIAHAINVNELGGITTRNVWTGSQSDGSEGVAGCCISASFGYQNTAFGNSGTTGSGWIKSGTTNNVGQSFSYYGISDVLTTASAAVPEPQSLALVLLALGGAGLATRRRGA